MEIGFRIVMGKIQRRKRAAQGPELLSAPMGRTPAEVNAHIAGDIVGETAPIRHYVPADDE